MSLTNSKWKINVSRCFDQGGRNYMEDFCYSYIERSNDEFLFGIFGIFDGHGGTEAAKFVQENLKNELIKIDRFWSNDNQEVLESIKSVYSKLQKMMWIERENWIKTISGYKSTAGTTATIAIIRNGILYTGHVGDSSILLLYLNENNVLQSQELTTEHKPDNPVERTRIESSGGSLKRKAGIDRVIWNRKRLNQSTVEIDRIPFLAVARSLGDLWSYDAATDSYHVSPEPDVAFLNLDSASHRAVIIASDGLWNVITEHTAAALVTLCQHLNRDEQIYNPANMLVSYSLHLWRRRNIKADNISAIVVLLHPETSISLPQDSLSPELQRLHSELVENNLLDSCISFYTDPTLLLSNIPDWRSLHSSITTATPSHDCELLRDYLLSDSTFSMFCDPWQHSAGYWRVFFDGFGHFGCHSFPSIVSHLESISKRQLESMMLALPWSICCMDIIDAMTLSTQTKSFLQRQSILGEFWTHLYFDIVRNSFQLFINSPMSEIDRMRNVLVSKSMEINNWIMSRFIDPNGAFPSKKYTLKKANTAGGRTSVRELFAGKSGNGSDVITLRLKRSASFNVSSSNLFYDVCAGAMPIIGSDTTASMNTIVDCDDTAEPEDAHVAGTNRDCHNVPFSLKRKISENVTQLIFIPCPDAEDDRNTNVIKKFALTKTKRLKI